MFNSQQTSEFHHRITVLLIQYYDQMLQICTCRLIP